MPKHLYLLRHAQSAEKQIGQPDKSRELTALGLRESLQLGTYLRKQNILLDVIVSSEALRAKSTAQLVADALKIDPEKMLVAEELYEASVRIYMKFISTLEDNYQQVLCVGHNPVISYFAEYLTKAEIGEMETAGLAIVKFNFNSWKEISQNSGELITYVYPKMLSD